MLYQDATLDIKINKDKVLFSISQNRLWFFFLAFNFAFISLDIYIAHFLSPFLSLFLKDGINPANTEVTFYKLIPFIFSPLFALVLLKIAITDIKSDFEMKVLKFFIFLSVVVGLLGFYYHIVPNLHFTRVNFGENFIYGAPIFTPLMYVILPLYLPYVISSKEKDQSKALIYLTAIQFLILVILSAFEHSHNYFASIFEWIPIAVGFFIFTFLIFSSLIYYENEKFWSKSFSKIYLTIMIVSIIIGIVGFGFHLYVNVFHHTEGVGNYFVNAFVGSPIVAPLSFANASLFGLLVYFKINKR